MSDLSASPQPSPEGIPAGEPPRSPWLLAKKLAARLQDWFVIQSVAVKILVIGVAMLIPLSGLYSDHLSQRQAVVAQELKAKTGEAGAEVVSPFNQKTPVVFGTGSVLAFLEGRPVERIIVIYQPLMWNVSERIMLIESQGKQYAFYPSDMESKIFADKAVTAGWSSRLNFVPRADLDQASIAMLERLDQRFAGSRPQSEKDGWKAGVSGVLSAALTVGLLGFLVVQLKGQFKSLKFLEPGQVQGSIEDLVGMDDIKSEVAQIKDQYERRTEYAEYGINKPFNVMFSGPAGTGKT
jgi:cell division protease FtsH